MIETVNVSAAKTPQIRDAFLPTVMQQPSYKNTKKERLTPCAPTAGAITATYN